MRHPASPSLVAAALPGLLLLVLLPAAGHAQCPVSAPDLPDACACAGPSVNWPTSQKPADPFGVALELSTMTETCDPNRGQPYWQIQRNYSSSQGVLDRLGGPVLIATPAPQPWASEFVSHAYARAQVPYPGGFRSGWSSVRYPRNPEQLIRWFELEEIMPDLVAGAAHFFEIEDPFLPTPRGHWIDGTELDLDSFQPGINAPCPGAVQIVDNVFSFQGNRFWGGVGHSQILGDMVVYYDVTGRVYRIDVEIIQGDTPTGAVHGDGSDVGGVRVFTLQNLQDYTPNGWYSLATGVNRKIRGWGVPLEENGAPICDTGRITTIQSLSRYDLPFAPEPDPSTQFLVTPYLEFLENRTGETTVVANFSVEEYMPSPANPWEFPAANYPVPPQVELDLRGDWPEPIIGVELYWANGQVPESMTIELETNSGFVVAETRDYDPLKAAWPATTRAASDSSSTAPRCRSCD